MNDAKYSYPRRQLSATGIELEYMVVDRETLDVRPIVDELMRDVSGEYRGDFDRLGDDTVVGWSNELALHVVELKTNEPLTTLDGAVTLFMAEVAAISSALNARGAMLLPTAMHPWMDPHAEMRLWPHEYNAVYAQFDRIFNCKGHGWANLQSTHINLPFGNDEEFGRLHAAIRLVLPMLPALAASSPIHDGRVTGLADSRLEVYRGNARAVPEVAGRVIPEAVFTRREYEERILGSIYRALAPHDPEGTLQHEWANSRGAIARFDRGSIEIRVIDVQECPAADVAVVGLAVAAVRAMIEERWMSYEQQKQVAVEPLYAALLETIRRGHEARIEQPDLLKAFGVHEPSRAGDVWRALAANEVRASDEWRQSAARLLDAGTLSSRIARATGEQPSREKLREVYRELADCLACGKLFRA